MMADIGLDLGTRSILIYGRRRILLNEPSVAALDIYTNEVVCLAVGEDGLISIEETTKISGDYPKCITILPDNKTLVSLNHDSNEIRTFTVDHEKKCVLMKNPPVKVDKPNSIVVHKLV